MKPYYVLALTFLLGACSGDSLEVKKQKLDKLKAKVVDLNREIRHLEAEIIKEDPQYAESNGSSNLVTVEKLAPKPFEHKFEVRASVDSRKNVLLSSEAMGSVERILVREGDRVNRGQLMITLDASILQNSLAELETNLDLATTVYQKRERLWKQNIGSEVQFLEAKATKESLERRLATTKAQLDQYRIVAPFSGVIDKVHARLGEMAQPGVPMVRILSVDEMHLEADISERYLGKISAGDSVSLYFPTFEREMQSVITAIGQVINEQNRTFNIHVALPSSDIPYKPNLVAVLKVRDYYRPEALVVSSILIQQDNQGDFLFVLDTLEGQLEARKVHVEVGRTYESQTEVLQGVSPGMPVITSGHRDITDGALLEVAEKETL